MDHRLLLKTSITAGEILLQSGAETRRVQDTMRRMLAKANLDHTEAVVVSTSIVATLSGKDFPALTLLSHIKERGPCFSRIVQVNEISRKYCSDEISLEEAFEKLNIIKNKKEYSDLFMSIAIIAIAGLFPILIAGSLLTSVIAMLNGVIVSITRIICNQIRFGTLIENMIVGFSATIIPFLILPFFGEGFDTAIIITAVMMPLIPGDAITNAVRDTLEGDYVSGGAHFLEGCVKMLSLGLGVGLGMLLF